jgi:hypothetical protein
MGARDGRGWQEIHDVLGRFSASIETARQQYRDFVALGINEGARVDFDGGGLVRSVGGWKVVKRLRRARESFLRDERVLGSSRFVGAILNEVSMHQRPGSPWTAEEIVRRVAAEHGVAPETLLGTGRGRTVARMRDAVAYLWIETLGRPAPPLAELFGRTSDAVRKAAKRGAKDRLRWQALLTTLRALIAEREFV